MLKSSDCQMYLPMAASYDTKTNPLSKLILPGCETYQGNIMLYQIKPIIKVHIPWRQNVRQHRTAHNMRRSGYIWPGCETYQRQHRSMHNMGTLHLYQWQQFNMATLIIRNIWYQWYTRTSGAVGAGCQSYQRQQSTNANVPQALTLTNSVFQSKSSSGRQCNAQMATESKQAAETNGIVALIAL